MAHSGAFALEEPALRIDFELTEATLPAELRTAGIRERRRDPYRGSEWEVTGSALGERWRVVLLFGIEGRLRELRLEAPPGEPVPGPFDGQPPPLAGQLAPLRAGVLRRRAALTRGFGPGEPLPTARGSEMPCPSMSWRDESLRVVHEMEYVVERGSDDEGWFADVIRIAPSTQ